MHVFNLFAHFYGQILWVFLHDKLDKVQTDLAQTSPISTKIVKPQVNFQSVCYCEMMVITKSLIFTEDAIYW